MKENIEKAMESVEQIFHEEPHIIRSLQALVEPIARGVIEKATIRINKKTTAKIYMTKDSTIRVERSDTTVQAEEC